MTVEREMLPGSCTLDHDGCITCSDAGIPVRIVSVEGDDALCEDGAGNQAEIAVELVSPVEVWEILLTHGGVAIGRVSEQKADKLTSQPRSVLTSATEGSHT